MAHSEKGYFNSYYIITEVCEGIWKILAPLHMSAPAREMLSTISDEIFLTHHFLNYVSSIDGKHKIKLPSNSGRM
jgi:hypothetical protein